jgi:hypothetical protein
MSKAPSPRGGIAGAVLIFCLAAAAVGFALDFGAGDASGFWIGARPGGAAAIGALAAIFCVAAARIARIVLGRGDARRSGDADPHA